MGNYYLFLLLLISVILFFYEFVATKSDLTEPGTGAFLFFTGSIFCAFVGNSFWENEISFVFVAIVVVCFFAVILGVGAGRIFTRKQFRTVGPVNGVNVNRININKVKVCIVIGITVFLTFLYVYEVLRLGRRLGASGLSSISAVRGSKDVNTNFLIRQGIKFVMASAYVNSFVFVNNRISQKKKSDFVFIIPTICGCVCSVFTGVRTEIYRLIIAIFVYFCFLNSQKTGWKKKNYPFKKLVKKMGLPVLGIAVVFFGVRKLVKVTTTLVENNKYNFIEYLLFYFGSPWVVLNNKINMGLVNYSGNRFGELTFSWLWQDLMDFGIVKNSSSLIQTKFIIVDNRMKSYGNVDTMFGNPLVDFGLFGTFIFTFILFFLLSFFYKRYLKGTYDSYKRNKALILYSFLYYMIGLGFYSNIVASMISVYFILTVIIILVIYWFYFGIKFKINE